MRHHQRTRISVRVTLKLPSVTVHRVSPEQLEQMMGNVCSYGISRAHQTNMGNMYVLSVSPEQSVKMGGVSS